MSELDIAPSRLVNQGIARPLFDDPAEVVRYLGAVQAQDYAQSLWAVGLRTRGATVADVERAISDATILRTWPMRGTIHFVPARDAKWMVELLAGRRKSQMASVYRKVGLDDAVFRRGHDVVAEVLQGGEPVMRKELYRLLEQAGIATGGTEYGGRGLHILGYLALSGLVCIGPREGKQPTFVLLDEWVPNPVELTRSEALAELTRRYFTSHGPATAKDFAWWSGLTLAEVKTGLELAGEALISRESAGVTHWLSAEPPAGPVPVEEVHLLPVYDEYLVAYKDRSAALTPLDETPANQVFSPSIAVRGKIVGRWKRETRKDSVVVDTGTYRPRTETEAAALAGALERYGRFLGLKPEIVGN